MEHAGSIGDRVRDVRKRRGLSQRELAGLSGLSVSLVRKLEQGERQDMRLETLRKLATALRVPTSALAVPSPSPDELPADDHAGWEPVRRALAGLTPQSEDEPTVAGVRAAVHDLGPALSMHHYAAARELLPGLLRDADALGLDPDARKVRSQILNTAGYLLTQTRQFDTAELTLARAIDMASDRFDAAAAADTMLWLYLRQGRLADARAFAAQWADMTEPRFSRATVLELIIWGRFLLNMTNAAVRDARPGEAEDALSLAAAAASRLDREVRRHDNSQCVFGPVTVAYIRAETFVIIGQPDKSLAVAAALPSGAAVPYPRLVSRLRHHLDVASAHSLLGDYSEAFAVLQDVRQRAPEWLVQQHYARDIVTRIISRRRTLTPEMRDFADFMRLAL
jgi:transcriptional regulator with XRE-family HTH domain